MRRLLPMVAALLLVGCGGGVQEATTFATIGEELDRPTGPSASLSLADLDSLGDGIEAAIADVSEAFCDRSDGDPDVLCYIGLASADETDAEELVCGRVVDVVEDWTSASVGYAAFDSRDNQTIGFIEC